MSRSSVAGARRWRTPTVTAAITWVATGCFVVLLLALFASVVIASFATSWRGGWWPAGFTTSWFGQAWNSYDIKTALASLPAERTPTKADWERLSRDWRGRLDEQIAIMQRLRDTLSGCIGCGCLSLRSCALNNFGDRLAAEGPGPVKLLRD